MVSTASLSWWHIIIFLITVLFLSYLAERSYSKILTAIVAFVMIAVVGLRHGYIDTRAYRTGFVELNISEILKWNFIINGDSKGRGFSVLSAIIKIFTENSQAFLFIIAFITVGFLFYGIVRNAPKMTFAVLLFICTGCYLDTMNGMRQALASAIMFAFLPRLIQEKRLWKYMLCVLICATIHSSVFFFIPLYFVADKKAWSKWSWGILGVSFLIFIFFNSGIGSIIVNLLEGTTYGTDYSEMLLSGNTSVNLIRPLVAFAPLVLSFMDKGNEEKEFQLYDICFNMSIINFLTWIFATKVLYFYRLAVYFQPYMILLLCYEIYYMRNKSNQRVIKYAAVILFLIWHWYSLRTMGDTFFVGYLKY